MMSNVIPIDYRVNKRNAAGEEQKELKPETRNPKQKSNPTPPFFYFL